MAVNIHQFFFGGGRVQNTKEKKKIKCKISSTHKMSVLNPLHSFLPVFPSFFTHIPKSRQLCLDPDSKDEPGRDLDPSQHQKHYKLSINIYWVFATEKQMHNQGWVILPDTTGLPSVTCTWGKLDCPAHSPPLSLLSWGKQTNKQKLSIPWNTQNI